MFKDMSLGVGSHLTRQSQLRDAFLSQSAPTGNVLNNGKL